MTAGGHSGSAVASHPPIVMLDGNHFAVSPAQRKLIAKALRGGGSVHVKGGEVRTARALGLFGDLRDEGALSASGAGNPDGERWVFTVKARRVTLP